MDSAGSDTSQCRTALVGRYLAFLSETRLAEIEEVKEVGGGYTFFWSVYKSQERREAGVCFPLNQVCQKTPMTNDRLLALIFPLSGNKIPPSLVPMHLQ